MISRILTLFKIARKLAKSDALKVISKHYDIPFIVKILSGVFNGKSTGSPISFIIYNEDQKSKDYSIIKNC